MGKIHEAIDGRLRAFIEAQPMFFVATAPSGPDGHVNVSPKGIGGSFVVLDDHTVAYVDLTASGAETIAHLRDNGRITLMFCAFDGPPRILRLQGRGEPVFPGDPRFDALSDLFPPFQGVRSVIRVELERISTSCGYAVPLMDLVGDRDRLIEWATAKGDDELVAYRASKNATSVDDLPGFPG